MRICHLSSAHPYTDVRIWGKECASLVKAGYETHLIAPGAPSGIENGVHLHGVPNVNKNRLSRVTRTVWSVYQEARACNADLYHFHDPELILIGLALKASGRHVIYDIHEDTPRVIATRGYLPGSVSHLLSWMLERFENFAARQFSALVAATPAIGHRFRSQNSKTVVINNYPKRDELFIKSARSWEERQLAICYVGNITLIRGAREMVLAMGCLPESLHVSLELAGTIWPESLPRQMMTLPGWDRVCWLGQINRQDVAGLLGRVRAGLVLFHPYPNHIDAQPNKFFEYMSAGLPVIASDFPLWRDIIKKNNCGLLVNPLDIKAIASAIEYLLNHPVEAEIMGNHGRESVIAKYNWEGEENKLLNLYEDLTGNPTISNSL